MPPPAPSGLRDRDTSCIYSTIGKRLAPAEFTEKDARTNKKAREDQKPNVVLRIKIPARKLNDEQAKVVHIKLFAKAKDWKAIREIECHCSQDGSLNLLQVAAQLGVHGKCRVVDPRNFRPFHEYAPGIVESGDVETLTKDQYLRVIVM
ncbi:hypothetical protein BKA93DRAFT_822857 [Sparassis latifolia]